MVLQHTFLNKDGNLDFRSLEDKKISTARIIAVTSGKGGVGKTNVSTNLGIALAGLEKKVCILDADMGLANINILIGKNPDHTIEDVLSGEKGIHHVLMDGPGGIKIIPGSSGLEKIVEFGPERKERLVAAFEEIEKEFDYILIDTSAGISATVLSFVQSAQDAVIVVSPEPTSLTDAYALIKILKGKGFKGNTYVLVNMVLSYEDSVKIFNRFNAATRKYLSMDLRYLGHVIMDQGVIASVIQQKPIMILKPESIPSRCFVSIARKFESIYTVNATASFSQYWKGVSANQKEVDPKGIITTPKEIREKISRIHAPSLADHVNKASQMIRTGACSEDKAREFIQKIEYSFTRRFDKLPYDLKTALYSSFELSNFSEENIKELNQFLESIYEQRFKRPLHSIRETFIKLLEESILSEAKMKILLQLVENSFRRRFKKPIYNLKEMLMAEMNREDFFEDGFAELIKTIKEIYQNRFRTPYKEDSLFPLADVEDIFKKMKEQEQEFDDLIQKTFVLSKKREESQNQLIKIISEFSRDE